MELPLINKEGRVVSTRCMTFQLGHDKVSIYAGIRRFAMAAAPIKELQCYVLRDWHKGDWEALQRPNGLDSTIRKAVGPSAVAKGQKARQFKPFVSRHCKGGKDAIAGTFQARAGAGGYDPGSSCRHSRTHSPKAPG